jgi:transposase
MERKVKYDYKFKLECLKLILEKHYSFELFSKEKGPNESNIRKWVDFYRKNRKIGLLPKKNQSHTIDFEIRVLKSIVDENLSLRKAFVEFNIPNSINYYKMAKIFF